MVDLVVVEFAAEAEGMRSFHPTQVCRVEVIVVAKLEWIRHVGIAERRKSADAEIRIAALQWMGAVGSGNSQNIQTIILI